MHPRVLAEMLMQKTAPKKAGHLGYVIQDMLEKSVGIGRKGRRERRKEGKTEF